MEEAGLPITEPAALGQAIALATAAERAEQTANWRECLEHLLHATIDAWKGGEKPTVGGTLEDLEAGLGMARDEGDLERGDEATARRRLSVVGLGLKAARGSTRRLRAGCSVCLPPRPFYCGLRSIPLE